MGGDRNDPLLRQLLVQRVIIVGFVTDQARGKFTQSASSVFCTSVTSWGEALSVHMARGRPARSCHRHELRTFALLGLSHLASFSDDKGAIDEAFVEIQTAALA